MRIKNEIENPDLSIRWQMFRGFRDTGWIIIKPLTILIGCNNAGKTSLIAPFLILKQTVLSPDIYTNIVSRGGLINLGSFNEITFNHLSNKEITFSIRYHFHKPEKKLKTIGSYYPGAIEVKFKEGASPNEIILSSLSIYDIYNREYLTRKRMQSGNYSLTGRLFTRLKKNERKAIITSRPVNFLFSPSRVLSDYNSYNTRNKYHAKLTEEYSVFFSLYLNVIGAVYTDLGVILRDIAHIGPIREKPKRFYETSGEIPKSVGSNGEKTPQLLFLMNEEQITRVNYWIKEFEIASSIKCTKIHDAIFKLDFYSSGNNINMNLADIGFGASQILPIIVQSITAKKASITIAEEPEIHLNPRLQSKLADLFVEMANNGQRIIVETHSEHLLLKLRRLLVEGKISPNKVAIYFIEKINGESIVRSIPISRDGKILPNNWPKGFFEETLSESLALITAKRKK